MKKKNKRISDWKADPVAFFEDVWGDDVFLWDKFEDIARAVAKHKRVVVPSGHGMGKTFCAAHLALWFLCVHEPSKVITTARSWDQVKSVLWSEIASAFVSARIPIGGRLLDTELKIEKDWFAVGVSPKKEVGERGFGTQRMQGYHSENLLIIIDEAGATDPDILTAAQSLMVSPNNKILMIGNPTSPSGPFYDACRSPSWHKIKLSCFDHPNVKESKLLIPGAVTKEWLEDRKEEWEVGSPLWQSKVCGEFPTEGDDSLISLAWLEKASSEVKVVGGMKYVVGIDVAGDGEDFTVVCLRQRNRIISIHAFSEDDPRGQVLSILNPIKDLIECVNVDKIGIGYNFALHLQDRGYNVNMINVGMPARDTERFFNSKAEYYWGLRQRFKDGEIQGLSNEKAIHELSSIKWGTNPKGQTFIESKIDAKKRGIKSPDHAEAIMLAFAINPDKHLTDNISIGDKGVDDMATDQHSTPQTITGGLLDQSF